MISFMSLCQWVSDWKATNCFGCVAEIVDFVYFWIVKVWVWKRSF
jgi:hypothetical protein